MTSNEAPHEDLSYVAALHARAGELLTSLELEEARMMQLLAEAQRQEARASSLAAQVRALLQPGAVGGALRERVAVTQLCLARSRALTEQVHQSLQRHRANMR